MAKKLFGKEKKMMISRPIGFKHNVHVGFNQDTGEFFGLPREWKQILDQAITKEEQSENPEVCMYVYIIVCKLFVAIHIFGSCIFFVVSEFAYVQLSLL